MLFCLSIDDLIPLRNKRELELHALLFEYRGSDFPPELGTVPLPSYMYSERDKYYVFHFL